MSRKVFYQLQVLILAHKKNDRVKETIKKSIYFGSILGTLIFIGIVIFKEEIIWIFTNDTTLLDQTPDAMIIVFIALHQLLPCN